MFYRGSGYTRAYRLAFAPLISGLTPNLKPSNPKVKDFVDRASG